MMIDGKDTFGLGRRGLMRVERAGGWVFIKVDG